jgi:hypothetical protein
MNRGHLKPSFLIGSSKDLIVFRAKAKIEAFSIAAFSRSRNPRLATSFDITMSTPGRADLMIAAARSSCL